MGENVSRTDEFGQNESEWVRICEIGQNRSNLDRVCEINVIGQN